MKNDDDFLNIFRFVPYHSFFFVLALRPIHLLLTDGQSFKCVMYNTCCFLLKLIGVVLQHHQVLSNSDEKQKSLKYDTFN